MEVKTLVSEGDLLARILDPYEGCVREEVRATCDGVVFFRHADPLIYADTVVFKLIPVGEFRVSDRG